MAASSPSTELTGRLLGGRYRLHRSIASGGMAQVFEATDEVLARRVAVKILHPHLARDEAFVRRFRAEAVAAARLTHPSIVSVYDTVVEDGLNAIVMELVTGTTLRADIDAHGPVQLAAALAIGSQVADALAASHASGLVHRDVKPANILLSADGRVLVADFGIAKAAQDSDHTDDGAMVGTAKYLAPEQVEGAPVDGRTDVYALGIVLYEALTGVPPFKGDNDTATALMRLHADPVRPRELRPDIPPAVETVIGRALARRPDDRFPNAAAMRSALLKAGADPSRAHQAAQAAVASAVGPTVGQSTSHPLATVSASHHAVAHSGSTPRVAADHGLSPEPAKRRIGAVLVVLSLLLGAFAAATYVTLTRDNVGPPVAIASFAILDPPGGDQTENDDLLNNLLDDDPTTGWITEPYRDADLTGRKPGVGLIARLETATPIAALDITSPNRGWTADIRVLDLPIDAEGLPADLGPWGEAVASIELADAGTTRVDLGGRRASAVMVWFTHVGDDHAVEVTDLEVLAK